MPLWTWKPVINQFMIEHPGGIACFILHTVTVAGFIMAQ